MKSIVLVGRPNVGKSSLFNALTKSKNALVADIPGLTRDRHYGKISVNNSDFFIIDTGGLDNSKTSELTSIMVEQTNLAIDESDIIFFIVDARDGLNPYDEEIARNLRKKNKDTLLIINKCEHLDQRLVTNEFKKLGFKKNIQISTAHNNGLSLINEFLIPFIGDSDQEKFNNNDKIRLSILGKPNVGKSTLINTIIGQERFIAFNEPGTTRDAISTDFVYNDQEISIVDTAGIRKKGRVDDKIEKFSILKSLLTINQSSVCILVINADDGITSQDLQILGYIIDSGKPLAIAINKIDILDSYQKEELKKVISKKIHFFKNYEIFNISALKRMGIDNLMKGVLNAYKASKIKIKTPLLNKFLSDIQITHQPPIIKGIRPKLKYMHQGDITPPTFIIHGNHLLDLKKDYLKFIESHLTKVFKIKGSPVKLILNESNNPFEKNYVEKPKKTGLVTRRKEINKKREAMKVKKRI